jgi:hypothetical protein
MARPRRKVPDCGSPKWPKIVERLRYYLSVRPRTEADLQYFRETVGWPKNFLIQALAWLDINRLASWDNKTRRWHGVDTEEVPDDSTRKTPVNPYASGTVSINKRYD